MTRRDLRLLLVAIVALALFGVVTCSIASAHPWGCQVRHSCHR